MKNEYIFKCYICSMLICSHNIQFGTPFYCIFFFPVHHLSITSCVLQICPCSVEALSVSDFWRFVCVSSFEKIDSLSLSLVLNLLYYTDVASPNYLSHIFFLPFILSENCQYKNSSMMKLHISSKSSSALKLAHYLLYVITVCIHKNKNKWEFVRAQRYSFNMIIIYWKLFIFRNDTYLTFSLSRRLFSLNECSFL